MRKLIDEFDSLPYRVEIEKHSETGFPFLNKQGTKEQASKNQTCLSGQRGILEVSQTFSVI